MVDEQNIFVAFDTETTGLSAADGRIVEIAALKFDLSGNILGEFCELVNPGTKIPPRAMAVHHITDEMVDQCPLIDLVLPRFIEFFLIFPRSIILVKDACPQMSSIVQTFFIFP